MTATSGGVSRTRGVLVAVAAALVLALAASSALPPANGWSLHLLVGGLVLGSSWVATGLLLPMAAGRLRSDALLWVTAGLVELVAALGGAGWAPAGMTERLGLVAALSLLPAAVVGLPGTWPTVHRVVVLPLLGAAGVLALVLDRRTGPVQALALAVLLVVIAAVWWRFEQGDGRRPGPERDALVWLALALGLMLLVTIPAAFLLPLGASDVAEILVLLVLPVATVLGSRPLNAVEIRTLAARAGGLLLSLLTALALFAGAVSLLELAGVPSPALGLLGLVATGVAALFAPMRRLIDMAVERLLFGDRLDPVGAASRFAAELSAADDPVAALRELRSLLNLPYAAVADGRSVLASGRPSSHGEFALPLTAAGHRVGELRLGLRPGETAPAARDQPVLRIVVPALAQALRARSLAEEVAASRERVVLAVEEDRRRLRRDLHDGLGPTLTGVAYATDAARNLLRRHPAQAEELLAAARADTGRAITEIRELVDGLRPSVLDQLGLVPAIQQQAAQLRGRDGRRIEVSLDLTAPMPALSAATEVAVFRIISEALTNVARHSDSGTARVRLDRLAEDVLLVEIADHGSTSDAWVPGVGLQSIQERVDQLGGTVAVGPEAPESADGGGGRVQVTLPIR
ncbi:sensor histidine kinase [uncultured Friedmanniella sp.]|uniref:sensor histidine kinase n=1 Tax=uncultured Friedmanniella sp. TaxID=335381 RepID=UPI0035CC54FF